MSVARTMSAAGVAALRNGSVTPGVTRLQMPAWRGAAGLLATTNVWFKLRVPGPWLYYARDAGALGPLELAFEAGAPSKVTDPAIDPNGTVCDQGPLLTQAMPLHPGTFMRLPTDGAFCYVRALGASYLGTTQGTGGTPDLGGRLPVAGFAQSPTGIYPQGPVGDSPTLLSGDDGWLVAQGDDNAPELCQAPGIVMLSAEGSNAEGQLCWTRVDQDAGAMALASVDCVFPAALRALLPRAVTRLTMECAGSFGTTSPSDQRVNVITAHSGIVGGLTRQWAFGTTWAGAVCQTALEHPLTRAGDPTSGLITGIAARIAASGRTASGAIWNGVLTLQKGPAQLPVFGLMPVWGHGIAPPTAFAVNNRRSILLPNEPGGLLSSSGYCTAVGDATPTMGQLAVAPGQRAAGNVGAAFGATSYQPENAASVSHVPLTANNFVMMTVTRGAVGVYALGGTTGTITNGSMIVEQRGAP